jgi:hypothetical protein
VELYFLEGKEVSSTAPVAQQQRSSREAPTEFEDNDGWKLFYNGTRKFISSHPFYWKIIFVVYLETHWIVKDLKPKAKYSFRAKSRNAYGYSNWSSASEILVSTENPKEESLEHLISTIGVPLLVALFLCIISLIAVFNCGKIDT